MKIFFRRIHLYLGLAAGLVIMVTCLTGAVLVYEKELQQWIHPYRYFTVAKENRLASDELIERFHQQYPGNQVASLKIFSDASRNAEIAFSPRKNKEKGKTGKTKEVREQRLVAFINPDTGVVQEIYNHRKSFFYFVMDLHRWMLGGEVGKLIVGTCTIIFLFILITGIVLWWPKNKAILKQRMKIKTDAGFKRLNHDYHVVLGFYTSIFLIVFAFTGLAWSFEWFNDGIYSLTKSTKERAKPPKSVVVPQEKSSAENALAKVMRIQPSAYYQISFPKDSLDTYAITLLPTEAPHESATDTYFIDQYNGKISGVHTFASRNKGQKIRATFKPIHLASIYGQPSKVIGFLACLAGTFFPASGILMWINRSWRRKKPKRTGALTS